MLKNLLFIFTVLFFSSLSANEIKDISVSGNERISKETILVYGNIKLGEEIDDSKINKILNNLYKTNFFEDIKISLKGIY